MVQTTAKRIDIAQLIRKMANDVIGESAKSIADSLKDGEVELLENVRFHKEEEENDNDHALTMKLLMVQGIATSIDALSVGFTIAEYDVIHALISCMIIGIVTLGICLAGLYLGRIFGTKLAGKAGILGGIILLVIGLEIFVSGVFM